MSSEDVCLQSPREFWETVFPDYLQYSDIWPYSQYKSKLQLSVGSKNVLKPECRQQVTRSADTPQGLVFFPRKL